MPEAPCLRRIGDFDAAWTELPLDVRREQGGKEQTLTAPPLELYMLADPARAIDGAALLRERVIADPPYWALVWTGARAIAALSATLPLEPGLRVLDLGCGLGAAGLPAARRGATVCFGDYLEQPLDFVRASLDRFAIEGCEVRRIDFARDADDGSRFDLILAADIVYDPSHYAPLAAYLARHLSPGGTILLTESLRADARVFLDGMKARGFDDERSALWVEEDGRRERTWLHTLQRRPSS